MAKARQGDLIRIDYKGSSFVGTVIQTHETTTRLDGEPISRGGSWTFHKIHWDSASPLGRVESWIADDDIVRIVIEGLA